MPRFNSPDHHDPWWGLDGIAAQRERQRRRLVTGLAFLASLGAFLAAAVIWALRLGIAHVAGAN